MAHSTIYEKLTSDRNDPVGAFAYIIYKQQKVEFCKSFGGRAPTEQELTGFHEIASLDTSIASYRAQAEVMVQAFLNAGLDDLVERTESETRQDVLFKHLEGIQVGLSSQIAKIDQALQAKRTFMGWLRDVTGNLVVNLVTVGVIGVLVLGYQFSGKVQQGTENKVGLTPPPAAAESSTSVGASSAAIAKP